MLHAGYEWHLLEGCCFACEEEEEDRRRIGGGGGKEGPLSSPWGLRFATPPPEARVCRRSKAVFSVATVPVGE
jgi:hypothetical protein